MTMPEAAPGWGEVPELGRPLDGLRVLDFSTLLPGPLATLLLAEAGADVLKVERPGGGDEMRSYAPRLGESSGNFALLNRGKRSVVADLKDPGARDGVLALAAGADVLVEQYRPGVMSRLGLGYADVSAVNPGIIYLSITGYGQASPDAQRAGHDLNYLAQAGILGLVRDGADDPALPHTVIADIAGGAYPAVINILLGLARRGRDGRGAHLDISMTDNVLPLAYGALAQHAAAGTWPEPRRALLNGGSPRYHIYRTADGRHLAAAPLEDRFWNRFCELVGLDEGHRTYDEADHAAAAAIAAVTELIAARTAEFWEGRFAGEDVCCCIVATPAEAHAALVDRPRWAVQRVVGDDFDVAALPVPIDEGFRGPPAARPYPALGEHGTIAQDRALVAGPKAGS